MNNLEEKVLSGENILYNIKPHKFDFFCERLVSPFLPFVIIWVIFDGTAIIGYGEYFSIPIFLFFLIHLLPVWIYLFDVVTAVKKYNNTQYIITDKAIYLSGGIKYHYKRIEFDNISSTFIYQGFFDNKFNVGDVNLNVINHLLVNQVDESRFNYVSLALNDIEDYQVIDQLINSKITKNTNQEIHPNDYYANNFTNTNYQNTTFRQNDEVDLTKGVSFKSIKDKFKFNKKDSNSDSDYTNWDK